jgi:hypothetical protein
MMDPYKGELPHAIFVGTDEKGLAYQLTKLLEFVVPSVEESTESRRGTEELRESLRKEIAGPASNTLQVETEVFCKLVTDFKVPEMQENSCLIFLFSTADDTSIDAFEYFHHCDLFVETDISTQTLLFAVEDRKA